MNGQFTVHVFVLVCVCVSAVVTCLVSLWVVSADCVCYECIVVIVCVCVLCCWYMLVGWCVQEAHLASARNIRWNANDM